MKKYVILVLILSFIIVLLRAQVVTLSGRVIGSDTNLPVASALVKLSDISEVNTDAHGLFSIINIPSNQVYTLIIRAYRYPEFENSGLMIGSSDLNLGDIMLYERTYPPRKVVAEIIEGQAFITWEQTPLPDTDSEWFTHTLDETAFSFMGCMHATMQTEEPAQRFTPAQLHTLGVAGATLTKVAFYASNFPHGSHTVKIYTGGSGSPLNSGNLIHSQHVPHTDVEWDAWNEITLDTPVQIPTSEELWIGISIYHGGSAIAAIDAGPAYAGYGDVYRDCGGIWTTLSSMGYSHNTMIKGMAETDAGQIVMNQLTFFDYYNEEYVTIEPNENRCSHFVSHKNVNYVKITSPTRALESYHVYRTLIEDLNDETLWTLVAQNVPATEYLDQTWHSAVNGDYRYIVKTVFTNNNISAPAVSNIVKNLPEGHIYIGDIENTTWTYSAPFSFGYSRSSLAQTIYFAEDINYIGLINEIEYQFRTPGDILEEMSVEIYMANVCLETNYFTNDSDWIPFDMFTLVYDGLLPVNLPEGIHDISIILDVPFDYTGENLVLYTLRKYSTETWSDRNLFLSSFLSNGFRTIRASSYTADLDPANPPNKLIYFFDPHIKLIFYTPEQGRLQGKVYSESGTPIREVEIKIHNTSHRVFTNALGEYSFSNITPGNYTITASKTDYHQVLIENVNISAGETTIQYIPIEPHTSQFNEDLPPIVTGLITNYPNPFNPSTTITYSIAQPSAVKLQIFNIKGQIVKILLDENIPSGLHTIIWNGTDDFGNKVGSGLYLYRITTEDFTQTKSMLLMK